MNDNAIKVDLNTAAEFAAKGFKVECYVYAETQAPKAKRREKHTRQNFVGDERFMLSTEGAPPRYGSKLRNVYTGIKTLLLDDDPTKSVDYETIRDFVITHNDGNNGDLAKLVRHYKVLRVVS